MEEAVELSSHATLTAAADVVHQLVHKNQARCVLGQKLADDVTRGGGHLLFMVSEDFNTCLAGKLERDLAPRSFAQWGPVVSATAGDRIELGAHKDRGGCVRDGGHAGP